LFQSKCFAKLREFKDRGTTVVFVTHSLDLVTTHCSRALLLDKGKLIGDGTPKVTIGDYNKIVTRRGARANILDENNATTVNSHSSSKDIEWHGLFNVNLNEDRYGSREAEILEAGIFDLDHVPVQAIERNREFLIKIKVRHNDSMSAAAVAFSIKDAKGVVLCGTNTLYQKIDMGQVEGGTVVLVVFRQVARLNAGNYLLSIGCGAWETGEYVVYDRRFDYIPFQVVGTTQRVGLFDPESEVEWKRLN
jgi:teichoic acid transport system ATP-binding protein